MISNQILQNTIDGLKGITRIDLCVIDTEGKVLDKWEIKTRTENNGVNVLPDIAAAVEKKISHFLTSGTISLCGIL